MFLAHSIGQTRYGHRLGPQDRRVVATRGYAPVFPVQNPAVRRGEVRPPEIAMRGRPFLDRRVDLGKDLVNRRGNQSLGNRPQTSHSHGGLRCERVQRCVQRRPPGIREPGDEDSARLDRWSLTLSVSSARHITPLGIVPGHALMPGRFSNAAQDRGGFHPVQAPAGDPLDAAHFDPDSRNPITRQPDRASLPHHHGSVKARLRRTLDAVDHLAGGSFRGSRTAVPATGVSWACRDGSGGVGSEVFLTGITEWLPGH